MKIAANTVVTLRYKLTDATTREVLDAGAEPMVYLHGGYDNIFPKVEAALDGQEAGFQDTLSLSPQDAFGERDEALLRTIPKSEFPPGVKVGGQLQGQDDQGRTQVFTVMKIKGPQVLLDGNHPLAGRSLQFSVKVAEVREATAEEIEHRHVHGAHGHHH